MLSKGTVTSLIDSDERTGLRQINTVVFTGHYFKVLACSISKSSQELAIRGLERNLHVQSLIALKVHRNLKGVDDLVGELSALAERVPRVHGMSAVAHILGEEFVVHGPVCGISDVQRFVISQISLSGLDLCNSALCIINDIMFLLHHTVLASLFKISGLSWRNRA